MKQYFKKGVLIAGVGLLTLPVFAQKEKDDKDHQTIVITREAGDTKKTIIEINGDKVLINGKDVKDIDNVNVQIHKTKNGARGLSISGNGNGQNNWNFNFDNDELVSLFSEDSNRAMLGIVTDVDDKGAKITSVSKESAAEKAGLRKGDIITKIGDKKIEDAEDISEAVHAHKPGDKVGITLLRDGKEQQLSAELSKWKGVKMGNLSLRPYEGYLPHSPMPAMGNINFDFNRPRLGLSIQDTEDGKGVKVMGIDDGAAAKAGIKEDDIITHINDKEVNTTDEISKIIRENKDKTSVRMQVLRGGKSQNIEVRIPRKLKTANL